VGKKKGKIRADFRKNRNIRTREKDLTRKFRQDWFEDHDTVGEERISGKGDLTRKRTVSQSDAAAADAGFPVPPRAGTAGHCLGRVLSVQGLVSTIQDEAGTLFQCATRRLLKTLRTEQRHVVAAGDRVWFRPSGKAEGLIESIEPRQGIISRTSRGRQHILVTNVDQIVIVASAAEPYLKPNLIDRFLITAEKNNIRPLVCINKIDLVDRTSLQPFVGVLSQMGYPVFLVSAKTGAGVHRLHRAMVGRESVVAGQSGVGKSSLLNAIDPDLHLRVESVSEETQKGRHTTSTARLLPLKDGGYVVDTPGIRQFELWDVSPEEVAGYFRDLRPYVSLCHYPDCTHTHEDGCAVKDAVALMRVDTRRYESYVQLVLGD
jgi:ribosome biogenesis GTPase